MSTLRVVLCLGSSCHARGNRAAVETLRARLTDRFGPIEWELKGSLCLGRCAEGPVAIVNGETLLLAPGQDLVEVIAERWAGAAG